MLHNMAESSTFEVSKWVTVHLNLSYFICGQRSNLDYFFLCLAFHWLAKYTPDRMPQTRGKKSERGENEALID